MSPYICLNKEAYISSTNRANILKGLKCKSTTTNLVGPSPNPVIKILTAPMTIPPLPTHSHDVVLNYTRKQLYLFTFT
jgi:hypothetical protein